MKKLIFAFFIFLSLASQAQGLFFSHDQISTELTTLTQMPYDSITIASAIGQGLIKVEWGDGTSDKYTPVLSNATHNYPSQLERIISITSTRLNRLICQGGMLSSVDVSNNLQLSYLDIAVNSLTSINLSNNSKLAILNLARNSLANLDVSSNINLTNLLCYNNSLTVLDISNNVNLISLLCKYNSITSLDLSNKINLNNIDCHDNLLTSLDTSDNINLVSLRCSGNSITSLDISNNPNLISIICSVNLLSESSINNILIDLDTAGLSNGKVLMQSNTAPTGLGLVAKANLITKGWTVDTD